MEFDNFIEADIDDEEEIMNENVYNHLDDDGGYGIDDQLQQESNDIYDMNNKSSVQTQIDNILHMPISSIRDSPFKAKNTNSAIQYSTELKPSTSYVSNADIFQDDKDSNKYDSINFLNSLKQQKKLNSHVTDKKSSLSSSLSSCIKLTTASELVQKTNAEPFLYSTPPADGDYMSVILEDGSRKYLRKQLNYLHSLSETSDTTKKNQLLRKPIKELVLEAEELQVANLYKKTQLQNNESLQSGVVIESLAHEQGLWVEKYKPRNFTQLLSPETINREVLRALKQWDNYVFKKANPRQAGNSSSSNSGQHSNYRSNNAKPDFKDNAKTDLGPNDEDSDDEDAGAKSGDPASATETASVKDSRPKQKIILLSGPPGTGKTTLAHILATHCGYRPHEINASDDRTMEVLKEAVTNAMTANTIMGDKKPNCIILDEIDGIDNVAAIEMLVNMANASLNSKQSGAAKKGDKKRKGPSATPLTKPLVCICNDHYAPVLRELKKIAQLFIFQPPTEQRLIQRLKSICANEHVDASMSLLTDLCTVAGNDIRSCINTLQFAAIKAVSTTAHDPKPSDKSSYFKKNAKMDIGATLGFMIYAGLSDKQKDVFTIWKEIFSTLEYQRNKSRREKPPPLNTSSISIFDEKKTGNNSSSVFKYEDLTESISESGSEELIMSGIHDNLLKLRISDPDMSRITTSLDWLSLSDHFEYFAKSFSGAYHIMNYTPMSAVAVHVYCAQNNKLSKIEWPFKDKNEHYKRKQKDNILHSIITNPFAETRSRSLFMAGKHSVVLDVLSYVLDIFSPRVRAIPLTSLTNTEKDVLKSVVAAMASCGINYEFTTVPEINVGPNRYFRADKTELVMEPNLKELLTFILPSANDNSTFNAFGKFVNQTQSVNAASLFDARHLVLQDETKRTIYKELKTYLIKQRADHSEQDTTHDQRSLGPTSAAANVAKVSLSHNDSDTTDKKVLMNYQQSCSYNASSESELQLQKVKAAIEKEEERQLTNKAKRGKMDMFCSIKAKMPKLDHQNQSSSNSKLGAAAATASDIQRMTSESSKPNIRFKFNQGFSNAVKRTVTINEFLN